MAKAKYQFLKRAKIGVEYRSDAPEKTQEPFEAGETIVLDEGAAKPLVKAGIVKKLGKAPKG
ncbi:MAG TPA: hypothetical protein VLA52_07140 [Thermohalobaculum sp.]|nr:hypothetical protein [Thermohalobaculum sp.]